MTDKPDFEALRRKRNEGVMFIIEQAGKELGCPPGEVQHNFNLDACYCACGDGGPCEHDFKGNFPIGLEEGQDESEACGWESRCTRCGMGALHHSLANSD